MSNAETVNLVRAALAAMLDHYGGDELITMLAEVMDDYAHTIARREGAYGRAAALGVMVKHLEGLDTFIDNYDPTEG